MKNQQAPAVILTNNSITVVFDDGTTVIKNASDPQFLLLRELYKNKDYDEMKKVIINSTSVQNYTNGMCKIDNGIVYYNGAPLNNYLTNKIVGFMKEGIPFDHLLRFLENLMANPSNRCIEQLYKFLETENLPITDDGRFLAYKRVSDKFRDLWTGKIDNSIGRECSVPRNEVDDDPQRGCSMGLHAGSLEYVKIYHGGNPNTVVIVVSIHPQDVVCIPYDDYRKLRTSKYKVVRILTEENLRTTLYSSQGEYIGGVANRHEVTEPDEFEEFDDFEDFDDYCCDEYCEDCYDDLDEEDIDPKNWI